VGELTPGISDSSDEPPPPTPLYPLEQSLHPAPPPPNQQHTPVTVSRHGKSKRRGGSDEYRFGDSIVFGSCHLGANAIVSLLRSLKLGLGRLPSYSAAATSSHVIRQFGSAGRERLPRKGVKASGRHLSGWHFFTISRYLQRHKHSGFSAVKHVAVLWSLLTLALCPVATPFGPHQARHTHSLH